MSQAPRDEGIRRMYLIGNDAFPPIGGRLRERSGIWTVAAPIGRRHAAGQEKHLYHGAGRKYLHDGARGLRDFSSRLANLHAKGICPSHRSLTSANCRTEAKKNGVLEHP